MRRAILPAAQETADMTCFAGLYEMRCKSVKNGTPSLLCIIHCIFICGAHCAAAEVQPPENNLYLRSGAEDSYSIIHGLTDGFERDLDPMSNAYAVVGEHQEYIFVLAYDWNRDDPERNCGYENSGLYRNDETHERVYRIPSPEDDSSAVISEDGQTVWVIQDPELPFNSDYYPLDMTYPVIRKYSAGELQYSISLEDIYASEADLKSWTEEEDTLYHEWCELEKADAEQLTFRDAKTGEPVLIDASGKITGVDTEPAQEPEQEPEQVRRHSPVLPVCGGVLLLLLIGGISGFAVKRRKQ